METFIMDYKEKTMTPDIFLSKICENVKNYFGSKEKLFDTINIIINKNDDIQNIINIISENLGDTLERVSKISLKYENGNNYDDNEIKDLPIDDELSDNSNSNNINNNNKKNNYLFEVNKTQNYNSTIIKSDGPHELIKKSISLNEEDNNNNNNSNFYNYNQSNYYNFNKNTIPINIFNENNNKSQNKNVVNNILKRLNFNKEYNKVVRDQEKNRFASFKGKRFVYPDQFGNLYEYTRYGIINEKSIYLQCCNINNCKAKGILSKISGQFRLTIPHNLPYELHRFNKDLLNDKKNK